VAERNHPPIRRGGGREAPGRCVGLPLDRIYAIATLLLAPVPRANLFTFAGSQSLPCLPVPGLASARVWPRTSRREVIAW